MSENWFRTNYTPIQKNTNDVMSEPNEWSVACRYPATGTAKVLYYFGNWLNFSSNVVAADETLIAEDAGRQEVVVPFYTHNHSFVVEMLSESSLSSSQEIAFVRAENFARAVRRLTDDNDENWSVVWRFTNLKVSQTNLEPIFELLGKISNVGVSFNPRSHVNKIQVSFTVHEDTED